MIKSTLVIGLFVAMGVFVGIRDILSGNVFEGAVAFGFVVMFLLPVIALQIVALRHTTLRASHDGSGTLLRPDRTFSSLMLGMFGIFIPFGIVVVVTTLTGHLHLFASGRGQAATVVGMTLVSGYGVAALVSAWRRGGVGYVKLTPTGIDIADIKTTESVAWADIAAVDDHSEVNKKTRKAVVLQRRDGTEKTIDGCDFYVPNGVGLYWMVWHYWRHPDDRPELTDGRALARLEEGRFDTTAV